MQHRIFNLQNNDLIKFSGITITGKHHSDAEKRSLHAWQSDQSDNTVKHNHSGAQPQYTHAPCTLPPLTACTSGCILAVHHLSALPPHWHKLHRPTCQTSVISLHLLESTLCSQVHVYLGAHTKATDYGDRCFATVSSSLWNSLPLQLREPDISFNHFKTLLKSFLF